MQYKPENSLSIDSLERIDQVCDTFEQAYRDGNDPTIESFIEGQTGASRVETLKQLLRLELELRYGDNRPTSALDAYTDRFPSHRQIVTDVFSQADTANSDTTNGTLRRAIQIRCPNCQTAMDLAIDSSFMDIDCENCGSRFNLVGGSKEGSPKTFDPGRFDKFSLIERVGVGNFGTVWKAHDEELDRVVALKIPRRANLLPQDEQKFFREARAAAQLEHPNIVSVHMVGRDEASDSIYIVSDLIKGIPLSAAMNDRVYSQREAATLCGTIASALAHAHDQGVVHRDLKPHNILIDDDNEPHITDFGLAKRETGEVTMTMDGQILGTPAYMPPEQASGAGHEADGRADIYSLGVILFQMLTGELPFRGNMRMLVHHVLYTEAPSPRGLNSNVSRDLETICLKCLEKDPAKRYQTAQALADDLNRNLRNEPIQARPIGWPARAWRWCQRNAIVASLAAAVVAALTIGLVSSTLLGSRLADSNARLADSNATNTRTLGDSYVRQCRLERELRSENYAANVTRNVTAYQALPLNDPDEDALRRELVGSMGDFVGLEPIVHDGFPSDVLCFTLHPDESRIAIGMRSGKVFIVDAVTKEAKSSISEIAAPVVAMRFSAAGQLLCLHTNDAEESDSPPDDDEGNGTLIVYTRDSHGQWNRESRHTIGRDFLAATFTPDGKQVTIWDMQLVSVVDTDSNETVTELRLSDVITKEIGDEPKEIGDERKENDDDPNIFKSVAYSPEKKLIAAAYALGDGTEQGLFLWDITGGSPTKFSTHNRGGAYANTLAFSNGGNELVLGTDLALLVYDAPTLEQRFQHNTGTNKAVGLSPDGQFFVAVESQGNVTIRSAASGNATAQLTFPIKATADEWVAFSDKQRLLVASSHDSIKVWNLRGADERRLFPAMGGAVPTVAYSPNQKWLACGSVDKSVAVYDAASGEPVASISTSGYVQTVRFSPDSSVLAIGHRGSDPVELWRWDASQNRFVHFADATHELDSPNRVTFINNHQVAAICDKGVGVWDFGKCETFPSTPTLLTPVASETIGESKYRLGRDISAAVNGKTLAWAEFNDGHYETRAWDWECKSPSRVFSAPRLRSGWHATDVVGNSNQIAFVTLDGQLAIWDVVADKQIALLGTKDTFNFPNVAVSPDGKRVAALADSKIVTVWDISLGKEILKFRPERTFVFSLAWNGNQQLAIGLNDGGIVVWEIDKIRQKLESHSLTLE